MLGSRPLRFASLRKLSKVSWKSSSLDFNLPIPEISASTFSSLEFNASVLGLRSASSNCPTKLSRSKPDPTPND